MTEEPDLSAYNLLIATPCFDGRPDDAYNVAYDATKQALERCGAKVRQIKSKYCADIYLVRAKLFSAFIRDKESTHMIFIDADMGWEAQTVATMLMLNRDMIGVAGPKKMYPLQFAYECRDDYFNPLSMNFEVETNVADVTGIGGAFLMISRACAEKMVAAYPELEFDSADKTVEYALFEPIIINKGKGFPRRRLSEDYSFCRRWRLIGGKVEMLMDATLTHTGAHTFRGNLLQDDLINKDPIFTQNVNEMQLDHGEAA